MQAYIYDEDTKEFLYETTVDESPLEPGVILMPQNATLVPINEAKENYTQLFNGSEWEYIEDYRGKTVWKNYNERITVQEIGSIPSGYSLERPGKSKKQLEEQFEQDFFNTSLGWVRRKVSMATGEMKDFLSDLLPTISIGVQLGNPVQIITYDKPDFTQEVSDWTSLQNIKTVTAEFVQECFLQLSNDFKPVTEEVENEDTSNATKLPNELDTENSGEQEANTDSLGEQEEVSDTTDVGLEATDTL